MALKSIEILGVRVNPLELEDFITLLRECLQRSEQALIANHNFHSVYLFHKNELFKEFYQHAYCVHVDGMPLIFWAKLLGYKVKRSQRLTYLDFVWPFLELVDGMKKSLFILGGREEVSIKALALIKERFPALRIDFQHGYFDDSTEANEMVLKKINGFSPDVLMVGIGMPRQEIWILRNLDRIGSTLIFNSGACFDYLTGTIPSPPRWAGQVGLEWLFRLFATPRRVYKRYLWEPWFLFPLFIKDIFKKR